MKRKAAALAALCLLFCLFPVRGEASDAPAAYSAVKVYCGGLLRLRGLRADGLLYLSPEDVCALFGLEGEASLDGQTYRLTLPGWLLEAEADSAIYTADGRWLYCPEGWLTVRGKTYFPAALSEKLFGLRLLDEGDRAVLDDSGFHLLCGGTDFYNTHFSPEDLYWLSHVIYAEAGGECLEGQLGVGNVVLNRVRSDLFPPTIMGVILDRGYVTQFDSAVSDKITAEPDETAVLAACLCLEGYNPVGNSLYFLNPAAGDDTWFENALVRTVTIGNHVFYA